MISADPLRGARILIVEDDFLIAEVLVALLEDAGVVVSGPIGTVGAALAFIDENGAALDHVILDLDLHGEKTYPIAQKLAGLALPFIFVSGYSLDTIDGAFRAFPHCEKPIRSAALLGMLAA